jgi:TonB family protein
LEVRFTSAQAAILIGKFPSQTIAPSVSARRDQDRYDAVLQHDVMLALCQDEAIEPGRYRTALDLWVTPSGHVERVDLLSSTGNEERDKRIVAALHALNVAPPPPNLARPITLLFLPKAGEARYPCDIGSSQRTTAR